MPESFRAYCSGCLLCAVNLALWVAMGFLTLPAFESGALPQSMAWLPWAGAALAAGRCALVHVRWRQRVRELGEPTMYERWRRV
jgi:hypothetical protein